MRRITARLLALVALLPLLTLALMARPPMAVWADGNVALVDSLSDELMCQCGCSYTVNACAGAMQCDVSEQMRKVISDKVAQGQGRQQVISYFASQYGEKVLAAPTKQGFNLTAWVTPFAAILAGAGVVYLILQAWVHRRGAEQDETVDESGPADLGAYGERVDRELEQFV